MEEIHHPRPSDAWRHDALCTALAAQGCSVLCRQRLAAHQIAVRFENGYGVTILPVSREDEVFEALVLRFYGSGSNDYQVAQYAPIPELNRGSFDEILDVCKQVALLPISRARTSSPGPA